MPNDHNHSHRFSEAGHVIRVGLLAGVFLVIAKMAAGIVGKSVAMTADSIHSLSDLATDVVVLLGLRIASRPVDKSHDYGHGKYETLTAAIIGISLLLVGARILWLAGGNIVSTFQGDILPRPGWIAFYAAVVSILIKEWLYRYTVGIGTKIGSQAVLGNAWHHRSDALSSLGAMVGIGGAIVLGEKWRILDPAAGLVVSFFIIKVAARITKGSINELLESSLSEETEERILTLVEGVPGVRNPHALRTRKIGNSIAIDIHIEVDRSLNITEAHDIATRVEQRLKESFGEETFVSVHFGPAG